MIGVAVCTAALVIVLSVFNGLETLLQSLYSNFDPEVKIESTLGKSFQVTPELLATIEAVDGVGIVTEVIEDYVYVKYRDADKVVTMKGVSENFLDQHRIDNAIVSGELKLQQHDINYAIIGRGIQYALSIIPGENIFALQVHYIKEPKAGSIDINKIYRKQNILPGSIFAIEQTYDENYIIVPLSFAKELLNYGNKRTSVEVKISDKAQLRTVIDNLRTQLGDSFTVLDRLEQQADLYKLLKLEKLFVFIAVAFILLVGSINIFFSLSMLAIDKKKDISVLYAMGAKDDLVRKIFMFEGAIIAIGGALFGISIGVLVCWLQQTFGLVSMGTASTVMSSYPVDMQLMDFVITGLTIIAITFVVSYRPAVIAVRFGKAIDL
jgi:lipoprotein-releasing system permease protein